jgi:hypothetical protein
VLGKKSKLFPKTAGIKFLFILSVYLTTFMSILLIIKVPLSDWREVRDQISFNVRSQFVHFLVCKYGDQN